MAVGTEVALVTFFSIFSLLTLLFWATIFMELLLVGFISELYDAVEAFDATDVVLERRAVRRRCSVVVATVVEFGRRFSMFDVELDLFTEPLTFSRMADGTHLALSDCLSAASLRAKISFDRALRKLLRAGTDGVML